AAFSILISNQGRVTVEAGIGWPDLFRELQRIQQPEFMWTFRQKQSGADNFSLGGALGANIHGRGLRFKPLVQDIESFDIVRPTGELRRCSRSENTELFQLAIGGYGLFGVVYGATLRLGKRQKLQRTVRLIDIDELIGGFNGRMESGYCYGDW